jgi:predicted ferric reductase
MSSRHDIHPAVGNGDNGHAGRMTLTWRGAERIPLAAQSLPPFAGKAWAVFLATLYPLLVVAPLAIFVALNPESDHPPMAELGVDCAVVGFAILSLQFLITTRLPWIEAPFGLDVILVFHRVMALAAIGLLCVHPLLVAAAEGWSLVIGLHVHWYIWLGRFALALLLLHVSVSLARRALHLSYEQWRRLHNVFAVTILAAGFVHSLMAGDDLHGGGSRVLWALLPAVGLAAWLYGRAIRPRLLARRSFRVLSIEPETPRVWTLTLAAPEGRPFRFLPGQFQFLRFPSAGISGEDHPFTIASSPVRADRISLTVKECGDFTRTLGHIRPGDRATVHGPFGRFSHDLHPTEGDLVFVAGGVGITPLMSMLRAMRDRRESRWVTLIYACRTADDILFAGELSAMEAGWWPALKVIYVLSEPPSWWSSEFGRVDASRLDRWCGGLDDKTFYLCCPPAMTNELIGGLRRTRVSPRRIHCDYFSL